jgi:hypothetical protein
MIVGAGNHHHGQAGHGDEQTGPSDDGHPCASGAQGRPTGGTIGRALPAVQRHRVIDQGCYLVTDLDAGTHDQRLTISGRYLRSQPRDHLGLVAKRRREDARLSRRSKERINVNTFTLGG